MRFGHAMFAALCIAGLPLASTPARAQDDDDSDDRVSLGIAVVERDGRLVVAHVIKDTPADEAGLQRGDEIGSVDGDRVRSAHEFVGILQDKEDGDEIELEVTRDGETETFEIELASYQEVREAAREDDDLRRRAREAASDQALMELRRQVQELQRQVRQLQMQRGGPQFGQQRFGQQRDPGQRRFGQQRDDRPQRFDEQRGPQNSWQQNSSQQRSGPPFRQQRDADPQSGGYQDRDQQRDSYQQRDRDNYQQRDGDRQQYEDQRDGDQQRSRGVSPFR